MIRINQDDEKIIKVLLLPKTIEEISEKTGLDEEKIKEVTLALYDKPLIEKPVVGEKPDYI